MITALQADTVLTAEGPVSPGVVLMEEDKILAAGARTEINVPRQAAVHDFGPMMLAPGLVDIHVHGGAGHDFMRCDAEGMRAMEQHLARHGVTAFAPTTVTAPWAETLEAVRRLSETARRLHLEGPFLSREWRGVHRESELLAPTLERFEQLWQASQGHIGIITVAPELAGAAEFIQLASARGVAISLGHSDATAAQARAGLEAGARGVTHTFNAMRGLHHREPGLVGEALTNPALYAELIADGIHVDPAIAGLLLRAKGPDRAVLVSDGISATGCGDGEYRLGNLAVTVSGGVCRAQGRLAGSILTLDQAVQNAIRYAGWPVATAAVCASTNPAVFAGMSGKGRLAAGYDADVVVLTEAGKVVMTFLGGRQVN